MAAVDTKLPRTARRRWGWLAGGLLFFIAAGGSWAWWCTSIANEESKVTETLNAMRIQRDSHDRRVELRISNVREQSSLTGTPSGDGSGAVWTVFDVSQSSGGDALMTLAVDRNSPRAAFIPSNRESGRKFVAALAAGLGHPLPPEEILQPLSTVVVDKQEVGDRLSSPETGSVPGGGSWTATEWTIQDERLEGKVVFSFDLASKRATFSEKGDTYSDDLLPALAAAVRDGRQLRTPENDPTFTTEGPRVVNLKAIPNSASWVDDFARGEKMLILTRNTETGASVRLVPLETPDKLIDVGRFDGSVFSVINEDAEV